VLFHNLCHDKWFQVNDIKNMANHEGHIGASMMPNEFWTMVTNMANTGAEDIDTVKNIEFKDKEAMHSVEHDIHLWWLPDSKVDLEGFNHMVEDYVENPSLSLHGMVLGLPQDVLQNKHCEFHKVRSAVKDLMTHSGNGANDPHSSIKTALKEQAKSTLKMWEAYYFYLRCKEFASQIDRALFSMEIAIEHCGNGGDHGGMKAPDK